MTNNHIEMLKSIVDEFNRAANQPILENPSMDADQKINALAEIIDLADIMATYVEEIIFYEFTDESLLDEDIDEDIPDLH